MSIRHHPRGYLVDAGHSLAGGVVLIRARLGGAVVESVHRKMRLGPCALLALALIVWLHRRGVAHRGVSSGLAVARGIDGVCWGLAIGAPAGLLLGFALQLGYLGNGFPDFASGNTALDVALLVAGIASIAGALLVLVSRGWRSRRWWLDLSVTTG